MRKKKGSLSGDSEDREDVPLVSSSSSGRENLFEGDDSGITERKKRTLPGFRRKAPEIKYGPNRVVYFNNEERNKEEAEKLKYCGNVVKTSTYTLWSFLPLNLFEQFSKIANLYFLITIILMLIPGLSPVDWYGTAAALAFVVGVSAIRAAYEDIQRHRADHAVNSAPIQVLRDGDFATTVAWQELRVGDIVRVEGDSYIPADLLLLNSSEPNGMAFVNTMNLDGETNTKPKQASASTIRCHAPMEIARMAGYVKSEGPNKNLDQYQGTLVLEGEENVALDNKAILYRGCQLVTAKHAYGLVIFTGKQTKLMKNNIKTRVKKTKLDKMLNKALIIVLIMLAVVCLVGAIGTGINASTAAQHPYLNAPGTTPSSPAFLAFKSFFTFFILFSGMVPISLYVSVEMVKVGQAIFIDTDLEMYDAKTDTPAKAKTTTLSEELGQISYIFSDKTGTLTRNEMEFKKCCLNGVSYGLMDEEAQGVAPLSSADNSEFGFRDSNIEKDLDGETAQSKLLADFWTTLAVCHTVLVEMNGPMPAYTAESPDEAALVEAASQFGWRFVERVTTAEGSFITVAGRCKGTKKSEFRFELLNVIEFNSTRKRMSVVVRETFGAKRILLMCKGADNVIKERLADGQEKIMSDTDAYLSQYAQIGLRTLLISHRILETGWYKSWQQRYLQASTAMENRDDQVAEVCTELEQQLTLLGATAIEDKLQEGVPETIANLAESGIKIWVLTGDKKDTAINIGFSCKLLQPWYRLIVIDAADWHETQLQMRDALERYIRAENASESIFALVIEGQTLHHALEPENRLHLLALATACKAVVCCRVSPKQKAEVVELVKKTLGKVCLSIGDGANDVSMIREAHIGVGISGHEGRQAVMAADYAIAQFRFLEPLLLIHGRYSYKRITLLVKYVFYKNYLLTFTSLWYALFTRFSGTSMFSSWDLAFYNLLFTSLPIIFAAILDKDLSKKTVRSMPQLYETGLFDHEFNMPIFIAWLVRGIGESALVFFIAYLAYHEEVIDSNGFAGGLWSIGICVYTSVVTLVTVKLALYINSWNIFQPIIMIFSWFLWIGFTLLFGQFSGTHYLVAPRIMGTITFWATVLLTTAVCLTYELTWLTVQRWFFPHNYQTAQYLQNDVKQIIRYQKNQKPLPASLRDKIEVLEMAKATAGLDPSVAYSGYGFSGTEGGRNTLNLETGGHIK